MKYIKKLISFLFMVTVTAICVFAVWVSIEPREVNWLGDYIEKEFSGKNLSVEIGQTFISLSPVIDVKNVSVEYQDNEIELPEVSVRISLVKLIKDKMLISEVIIKEPEILAYINKDNIILKPFLKSEKDEIDDDNGINDLIKNTLNIVDNIVIQDAKFSVYENDKEILKSLNTDIRMRRYGNIVLGGFDIYLDDDAYINSKVSFDIRKKVFNIYGRVEELRLDFFEDYEIDVPLKGGFNLVFHNGLKSAAFNFFGREGKIHLPEYFAQPFNVKKIQVDGIVEKDLVKINSAKLELPNGTINAEGAYGEGLKISAELENYQLDELYKHWSIKLAPKVREWVTEHIKEGSVPKANITIDGEKLISQIYFEDALLDYFPPLPSFNKVKGVARFDNDTMNIDISYGEMLNGTTKNASVDIKDFKDPFVDISIDINSQLKDIWEFLSYPPFENVNLRINPQAGTAKGKLYLQIPVKKAENEEKVQITFKADASFKDASFDMDNLVITESNGNFVVNNNSLDISSEGKINDFPATLRWHSIFRPELFHVGNIDIMVNSNNLPEEFHKYLDGIITVNAVTTIKETKLSVNLLNAAVDLMGLKKPIRKEGKVQFNLNKKEGLTYIEDLSLRWDNAFVAGALAVSDKKLVQANLNEVRFGNNDFKLNYKDNDIDISGKSLELFDFMEGKNKPSDFEDFVLKADLETVFVSGAEGFKDVKAKIEYKNEKFQTINVNGNVHKPFAISKFDKEIIVSAKDAGAFIKELGISQYMTGGELNGRVKEDNGILEGEFIIDDFVVKDAPALTQILSMASLTGILNTLSGSGISFDRAYLPFKYENEKFIIKEGAKATGSAIGITLEGEVENGYIDIHGTLIPSYTLNSFISNIPVVGLVLSGKEDGVFAVNYSVKGNYPNIKVRVNPLSFLAPNIIKSLLGVN